MRALVILLFVTLPAHADLYRWVDPQTGSVKLSSMPPTEPGINAQLVPFRNRAAAPLQPAPSALSALEARWSELLGQLAGAKPQDFSRSAAGFREHLEAYEAVRAELDRLDPAGAARRRDESASLLDRLRQGFAAQFSPAPPGQQK